jgi:hypothetical protein
MMDWKKEEGIYHGILNVMSKQLPGGTEENEAFMSILRGQTEIRTWTFQTGYGLA